MYMLTKQDVVISQIHMYVSTTSYKLTQMLKGVSSSNEINA